MGLICSKARPIERLIATACFSMVLTLQEVTFAAELQYYRGPADAQLAKRHALVLGTSYYDDSIFPYLPNPQNDAKLIRDTLTSLGFDVFPKSDDTALTKQTVKRHLYDYVKTLKKNGGASVIYFAGHGVSYGAESYLVPKDGMLLNERDLKEELIPMGLLFDAIREAKDVFHIVLVDACRNPTLRPLQRWGNEEEIKLTQGLQLPSDPPKNSIIALSTSNGREAKDGEPGKNSPYALAFQEAVQYTNEPVEETLRRIQQYFDRMPGNAGPGAQEPVNTNKAVGKFYFKPTAETYSTEKREWDQVAALPRSAMDVAYYDFFIHKYPAGYFMETARRKKANLPVMPPLAASRVEVIASNLNVRQAPEKDAQRSLTVAKGTTLRALPNLDDSPEGWTRIQLKNGNVGYVASDHVKEIQLQPSKETKVTVKYEDQDGLSAKSLSALESKVDWQNLKQVKLIVDPANSVEQVTKGLAAMAEKLASKKVDPSIVQTIVQPTTGDPANNTLEFIGVTAKPAL